jgi:hypothetical protein
MAGAGAKKFPANSKLTSDDVNNYLADQVVMRFATTAARDAAFGGVGEPTLAEGMTAYIDADNTIYTYDGSNWVKIVSASQPVGLQLIGTFTASNTSRALVCDNVFTDEYENYQVVVRLNSTIQTNACFYQYIDTSGNNVVAGYYGTVYHQDYASGTTTFQSTLSGQTIQYIGYLPNSGGGLSAMNVVLNIYAPRLSTIATGVTGQVSGIASGAAYLGGQVLGQMINTNAHRGIRFDNSGAGNLTGSVRVYGYRN